MSASLVSMPARRCPRFKSSLRRWWMPLLFGLLLASGCKIQKAGPAAPTLIPNEEIPTVIALTAQAMATQTASAQPSPTTTATPHPTTATLTPSPSLSATLTPTGAPSLSPTITQTPTITLTPSKTATATRTPTHTPSPSPTITPTPTVIVPDQIPFADIQILKPSPLSKVASPLELHAFLIPGAAGKIRVELLGEDGRLLYRQIYTYEAAPTARVNLRAEIDFEIVGVAETARLVISVDDEYGRTRALASTDVVLLALGESDLNLPTDQLEPIWIQQPTVKSLVQEEAVLVSGLARTEEEILLVELISTAGTVISSRLAGVAVSEEIGHRPFAVEVPFHVDAPTWVRVTVSERDGLFPRPKHISTVEVLLSP
jgi:hypothetical protein